MAFEFEDLIPGGDGGSGKDGGIPMWVWLAGGGVVIVGYLIFAGGGDSAKSGSVGVTRFPGGRKMPTNPPPGVTKAQLASFRDNIKSALGGLYTKISEERKAALEERKAAAAKARKKQAETLTSQLEDVTDTFGAQLESVSSTFGAQFDDYQQQLQKQFSNIADEFANVAESRQQFESALSDRFKKQFQSLKESFDNMNAGGQQETEPQHKKQPAQQEPNWALSRKHYATPSGGWNANSLVDQLKKRGYNASYSARKKLAASMGIDNYTGSAAQNSNILGKVKAKL